MKPPPRKRSRPNRFLSKESEPKQGTKRNAGWLGWTMGERRVLLAELKKQRKNVEVNFVALQAKLPKRSVQQIERFVQFLKRSAVRRVVAQVKKQIQEEREAKVPVELWSEIAQKMAGSQEDAISSAFSQMLVIAATEPSSLQNSDPPRPLNVTPQFQFTSPMIPLRSMSRPQAEASPTCIDPKGDKCNQFSSSQTPSSLKFQGHKGSALASEAAASPSTVHVVSSSTLNKGPSSSTSSNGPVSDQQTDPRPLKQTDFGVDFEKIYHFLNAVHKQVKKPSLSAMESAVILDLLLSLPEELTLLNCNELLDHMRQVHAQLTAPVKKSNPPLNDREEDHTHVVQVCGDTPGTSLQDKMSINQNVGQPDQPVLSGASMAQKPTIPKGNPRSQGEGGTEYGQNSDRMQFISESEASVVTAVSGSEPAGGAQPMSMDSGNTHNPKVVREVLPGGFPLVPQTAQEFISTAGSTNATTVSQNSEKDHLDWEKAGMCPLNPFMIPLRLLVRSGSQLPEGSGAAEECQP
ncbi:hypothetical protein JZ751_018689 [Albula glossodonta]|uniref:snRNA-activating protein complex subunit 2 n=1 Tax=Albula glossodonta TaxID=121402 RepID=A0A8T2NPS4_9TELE|nr:hypothetical protein JZ751_018689 [Albula glossodonta]